MNASQSPYFKTPGRDEGRGVDKDETDERKIDPRMREPATAPLPLGHSLWGPPRPCDAERVIARVIGDDACDDMERDVAER
eukprot:9486626-Pyramimonas_sp.AAC.1